MHSGFGDNLCRDL